MARETVAVHQSDCAVHDDKPCDCTCQRCKCCSLEFVDCQECGGEAFFVDPSWAEFARKEGL